MIEHGLISNTDAQTIAKTLAMVLGEFPDAYIHTCEVGIFNGDTSRGIHNYVAANKRFCVHTAIDSQKDKPVERPFPECRLIIGNSIEVYNELSDRSQHFIFIDGNHSLPYVIADFYCYADKVKVGGYLAFHDTGAHIRPLHGYQLMGSQYDSDMCIAVRKALTKIGLMNNMFPEWELVFDEADVNDDAGGITVFKRIY